MSVARGAGFTRDLRACAHAMADAARAHSLRHFRAHGLVAHTKNARTFDPVTQADRDAEAAMRAVLARLRPLDAILAEEDADKPGTSGLTWVLDPIDGTRAFLAGAPTWGTLIAVQNDQGPLFGLIDHPYTDERLEGGPGIARVSGARGILPLGCRPTTALAHATIVTTFPEVGSDEERRAFGAVARQCRFARYGLDCYGYALLALGHVDLVIEAGLNAYDVAAPVAVVEAAGGRITTWQGGPAHGGGQIVAAATAPLHAAALEILQKAV